MRVVATGGNGGATSVSWWADGLQIATLDAGIGSTFSTDGAVSIGYADPFSSISDNPALSFGLVNNLRIGTLAHATAYGNGCPGIAGDHGAGRRKQPELGTVFQLDATNLDPSVPISIMVVGLSNPAPVNLGFLGLGATCELLVSPDFLLTLAAAAGSGTYTLPIPMGNQFLGFQM